MKKYFVSVKNKAIRDKLDRLRDIAVEFDVEVKEMAKKYHFDQFTYGSGCIRTGISSISFPNGHDVDPKIWKSVGENRFLPKLNSKEGREIALKIKNLPTISWQYFNRAIIGWDCANKLIGFNESDDYVGVNIDSSWNIESVPPYFKEVSVSEYDEYFNITSSYQS